MFDFMFDPVIEEKGDYYVIRGVPVILLTMDFTIAYNTTYLPKAIIKKINRYAFSIHKFFLVEFHYTLSKIINQRKQRTPLEKLIKLHHLIETNTWVKDTLNPKVIDKFDRVKGLFHSKPFALQESFLRDYFTIKEAYKLKGLLLDSAVGSGKTLSSLMWSKMIGNPHNIIICPDGIVNTVWRTEITKHIKGKQKVWSTIDDTPIPNDADYYIIHYSALASSWAPKLEKWLQEQIKRTKKQFSLVIDECHNFNDETSKRSQLITAWGDMGFFSDSLPMSGTPLKALGRECYTIFTLIDNLFTGSSRKEFFTLYGKSRENLNELLKHRIGRAKFTIPAIDGMGATPPLETLKITVPNGQRFTLENVRSEMMLYIEDRVKFYHQYINEYNVFFWECVNDYGESVKQNKQLYSDYQKYSLIVKRFKLKGFKTFNKEDIEDSKFCKVFEEQLMKWLPREKAKHFKNIRSAVKYLGLKIRGEALGNVLGKMRQEAATALIQHAGLKDLINSAKKKTLIFSSYVDTVIYCEEYLKGLNFKPVVIYGDTNDQRDDNIDKLAKDPTANPGIATNNSLREGYQCTFANQVILLNAPFRDYELTQILARVWRKGQDSECFFWLMDLDTGEELNIASRSIDIMKWSADQVDQLIGKAVGHGIGHIEMLEVTGMEAFNLEGLLMEEITQPIYVKSNYLSLF